MPVKFSQLVSVSVLASGDLLMVTDVSDTTESPAGTSKKITFADFITSLGLSPFSITNATDATSATDTAASFSTAGGIACSKTVWGANVKATSAVEANRFVGRGNFNMSTTGSQNDISIGDVSTFRFTGVAIATITGIAGGAEGRQLSFYNTTAFTVTFTHNDAASAAGNRLATPGSVALNVGQGQGLFLIYSSGFWRVVGKS